MRLTLWYVAVLGGVLALYVAGTSAFLLLHLRHQLDATLADQVEQLEPQLSFAPDSSLRITPIVRDEPADTEHAARQYIDIRSLDGSDLRSSGIDITSIRNHTVGEHPQFIFVHFWGQGEAVALAKRLRRALDVQVGEPGEKI